MRGRKRHLSPEQELEVLKRIKLYWGNIPKQIAKDYGCTAETIRETVRRHLGPGKPKKILWGQNG